MTQVFFGIGSNVDAEHNVRSAITALAQSFDTMRLSPVYRSRAVGFDGDDFINLVAVVETDMPVLELRDFLRDLEDRHGRMRGVPKYSDRTLDIDILLYGELVADSAGLQLPRPEILRFAHVLKPLADLAPDLPYPGDGRSMARIWAESGLNATPLALMDPAFLNISN